MNTGRVSTLQKTNIIFIDLPNHRPLPDLSQITAVCDNVNQVYFNESSFSKKNINNFKETDIVIINFNDLDVLSKFILINPNIKFILIADQTLNQIVCEKEKNIRKTGR